MKEINIFWFRRDLRIPDNNGLYQALRHNKNVQPIFIFDTNILDKLSDKSDARVHFIYEQIERLKKEFQEQGSDLWVLYGDPAKLWKKLIKNHAIKKVYTNEDYEPYALDRDEAIKNLLSKKDMSFHAYKDHIIFRKDEVLKKDGTPYVVFTPYKRKWLEKLDSDIRHKQSYYLTAYPTEKYLKSLNPIAKHPYTIALSKMGFTPSAIPIPDTAVSQKIIKKYEEQRNFPAVDGTSRLGIHFRFGTISIREKARKARKLSDVYLSELVWRDFYSQILSHFPHVADNAFRAKYEKVMWRNNEKEFDAWCAGKTGYPIVDAGMRELNETGHMHNRVRMVVASFLTKHLLIDWRWGEAYFAEKLLDFDLASNNGGWQWAAGCGTDAAPYFRIFNPESQQKKFDKDLKYIKKWVKEWGTADYAEPIVEHKMARERCLATYKEALKDV